MTIETNGNLKIITADENRILVFGDTKCTTLYTPLMFDENQIDEVEYVVEVVEPSEVEKINDKILIAKDRLDFYEECLVEMAITLYD